LSERCLQGKGCSESLIPTKEKTMQRRALLFLVPVIAACGGGMEDASGDEPSQLETITQKLALFDYSASVTNYASDPNNSADYLLSLSASETVMIGTCGINESTFSGDTYLRLYNPSSVNVAANDNTAHSGCGLGSKFGYTAPSAGTYMIRAGCYANTSCIGTVAIARRLAANSFSVTNTNNATVNTFNKQVSLNAGDVVRVSTCANNAYGATASGDTYLRLFRNNAGLYTEVANNNTASGCGAAAEIVYTVPSSGYYQLRAGCATNTTCSGTVVVYRE
jgi:hypothetical protein